MTQIMIIDTRTICSLAQISQLYWCDLLSKGLSVCD